ncbi:MAG: DEAD/DEAH box helicase, partial [Nocardioidaceae bacterium]
GEAPVVVMTTEVLRNMLYAGSSTLSGLGFVVMDEVHYLADRFRGAVWEEVIIHLPESVSVVSLSATVSNAEEFGEWLSTVRGDTTTIVEERRPVPLFQHVLVGRRLLDLFADPSGNQPGDTGPDAKVNPELAKVARDDWASKRIKDRRTPRGKRPPRRAWIPSRFEVVDRLDRDGLLPCIYFIFSRIGCDAAVQQCLNANLRLTTPEESDLIRRFVEERCAHLPDEDLHVLGYHDFAEALSRGVAAHHAGMLPTFKTCVEELFEQGLCRVVFATETLALGINMPARSVVIEKLVKWNGETHADITPGEYTQLTGRAGRRGIDVEGHGVVLWQQGMDPRQVAGLASTRTYPLRSSFRPSYNMAVNLVHQVGRVRSRELLESSFAQFQADKAVVGLARQHRKAQDALDGYAEAATCHLGDFMEYAGLRRQLKDTENAAARSRRHDQRSETIAALETLRPGDVIDVPAGKYSGYAVVIDPGTSSTREDPRPYVLTVDRHARRLSMVDFTQPVRALTRIKVPRTFNGRNPQMRRDLAHTLHLRTRDLPAGDQSRRRSALDPASEREISRIRAAIKAHPCHGCPDREDHARWAERYQKLQRDAHTLERRIEQRTNTIARQFDRVCDVLTSLGYLRGDQVTGEGQRLMRIYSDLDLVAAEGLRSGLWEGLSAQELASALSALVYESRRADDANPPRLPRGAVPDVLARTVKLWARLEAVERDHRLDFLREPDLGFAWAAYLWAGEAELETVLDECDLAAGDFVRWVKQLVDLVEQVADAAGDTPLRKTARDAAKLLRRGVVAYSSMTD